MEVKRDGLNRDIALLCITIERKAVYDMRTRRDIKMKCWWILMNNLRASLDDRLENFL